MLYQRFGRPKRKPVYKVHVFALLSGALLVACFPTAGLWWLAWAALVPFLTSLADATPGRAFKAGFILGLPYFFGTQYWIYYAINYYGGASFSLSMGVVLALAAYESLFTGLFALLYSHSIRNTSLPATLLAPLYWTVLEFVRSYAFTGFPWSSLGYSQATFLPVIQFADITGVYGVSFLIMAVNGALADVFISRSRRKVQPLANLWPTAVAYISLAVALTAAFSYGAFRLHQQRPGQDVKISVVQGDIAQDQKWNPVYQEETINVYETLTAAAATEEPDLVVWPETAMPFYWDRDAEYTLNVKDFAASINTNLLFGAITLKEPDQLGNSAILLDKNGAVKFTYDKIHLVPFGEYVPLRPLLGLFVDKMVEGIGEYSPGKKPESAKIEKGSFGTIICYEVIFPGLVRKFYKRQGDFMVNITNDAWYGRTTGPYQHFAMGALRAVENRKPLVRAANTGISGYFDSNGRVLKSLPLYERGALTETIRTDTTRTFYSRFGDLFSYLCIITTVILLASIRRL